MVALFKDYIGRGPTRAKTYINEDVVTVLLYDTLTKAEQKLAEDGRVHVVRDIRRNFQAAMREDATKIVERETGREVDAFMSDNSIFPDYAVETFVLAPGLTAADAA